MAGDGVDWDGQPPPFSLQNFLFLGGLTILMLGTFSWVVLPVARKIQTRERARAQRVRLERKVLPGSESIWRTSLRAREARSADGRAIRINGIDGSVLLPVPAGRFQMGRSDGEPRSGPPHAVTLDGYLIGRYPVTNAQYGRFLRSSAATTHAGCHPLEPQGKSHTPAFWGKTGFREPQLPVVGVDWYDAYAYVAWAGLRLPTEAEWERAAGGTDGRAHPWGEGMPDGTRVHQAPGRQGLTRVQALPASDSPVGARQMVGHIWEWCYDRFDSGYYARSPRSNPKGPPGRGRHAVRGGSYLSGSESLDLRYRHWRAPLTRAIDLGFRCAR